MWLRTCVLAYLRKHTVVVFGHGGAYLRRMSIFRNTNSQHGGPQVGVNRLARFVGRLLLWGCVLLLLMRGIASYFGGGDPGVVTTTRGVGVTVTQPASTVPSNTEGK